MGEGLEGRGVREGSEGEKREGRKREGKIGEGLEGRGNGEDERMGWGRELEEKGEDWSGED